MGKAKKSKSISRTSGHSAKHSRRKTPYSVPQKSTAAVKPKPKPKPTIPFLSTDRILLVGEGDFSFSHSLLQSHCCNSLTATSYDKQSTVTTKYPQARGHVQALEAEDNDCRIIYGVDATKLGKSGTSDGGGKIVKKGGFDKIVFNFPHVGGLTKDVNRQVRHNQELLVGFFRSAAPLLTIDGSILVTVFEGEPYDLWNVRDLARHVGLSVGRSFQFQASAYPGYKHARTLGNIDGGGGWKGEDRPARTYVFETNSYGGENPTRDKKKQESSEEDSEDE